MSGINQPLRTPPMYTFDFTGFQLGKQNETHSSNSHHRHHAVDSATSKPILNATPSMAELQREVSPARSLYHASVSQAAVSTVSQTMASGVSQAPTNYPAATHATTSIASEPVTNTTVSQAVTMSSILDEHPPTPPSETVRSEAGTASHYPDASTAALSTRHHSELPQEHHLPVSPPPPLSSPPRPRHALPPPTPVHHHAPHLASFYHETESGLMTPMRRGTAHQRRENIPSVVSNPSVPMQQRASATSTLAPESTQTCRFLFEHLRNSLEAGTPTRTSITLVEVFDEHTQQPLEVITVQQFFLLLKWMKLHVAWEDVLNLVSKYVTDPTLIGFVEFTQVLFLAIDRHLVATKADSVGYPTLAPTSIVGLADLDQMAIVDFIESSYLASPQQMATLPGFLRTALDEKHHVIPLSITLSKPVFEALVAYSDKLVMVYNALARAGSVDTQALATVMAHLCSNPHHQRVVALAAKQYPNTFASTLLTYPQMCERLIIMAGLMEMVDDGGFKLTADLATPAGLRTYVLALLECALGGTYSSLQIVHSRIKEAIARVLSERQAHMAELTTRLEDRVRRAYLYYCAVGDMSGTGLVNLKKFKRFAKDLGVAQGAGEARYVEDIFGVISRQARRLDPSRYPPEEDRQWKLLAPPEMELSFILFSRAVEALASFEYGQSNDAFVRLVSEKFSDNLGTVAPEVLVDIEFFKLRNMQDAEAAALDPEGVHKVLTENMELLETFFEGFATGKCPVGNASVRGTKTMLRKDVDRWLRDAELVPVFLSNADVNRLLRSIGTAAVMPYNLDQIGFNFSSFTQLLVLLCRVGKGFTNTSRRMPFKERFTFLMNRIGCTREKLKPRLKQHALPTPSRGLPRSSTPKAAMRPTPVAVQPTPISSPAVAPTGYTTPLPPQVNHDALVAANRSGALSPTPSVVSQPMMGGVFPQSPTLLMTPRLF